MDDIISFSLVGVKEFLDRSDDQGNRSCRMYENSDGHGLSRC